MVWVIGIGENDRSREEPSDGESSRENFEPDAGGIGGGIVFGVYFRPLGSGVLRLGDEVTLLESQDRLIPNDRSATLAEGDAPVPPSEL